MLHMSLCAWRPQWALALREPALEHCEPKALSPGLQPFRLPWTSKQFQLTLPWLLCEANVPSSSAPLCLKGGFIHRVSPHDALSQVY